VSWDTPFTEQVIRSLFAVALENIGIPGAGTVMTFVVLTAVLSVLNSSLYTTSRKLFALTRHGDAPQFFTNTTRHGVPMWAIFVGTIFGYVAVAMYYLYPETVFTFLVNSSGAILLFIYLLIAVSELRMRRRLEREAPERLQVRMWLFPWLTYLSITCIVAVLLGMAFVPGSRFAFVGGSMAVSPDGDLLAETSAMAEEVLDFKLDPLAKSGLRPDYLGQLRSPFPTIRETPTARNDPKN
jgi:GABA permease